MAAVMAAPEAVAAPSSLLLLVVGGECGCPGLLAHILEELERGGAAGARAGGAAAGRGVRVGLGVPAPGGLGSGWGAATPDATFRAAGSSRTKQPPGPLVAARVRWVWVGARRPGPRVGQGKWGVGFRKYRVPGAAWGPGGRRVPGSGVRAGCGLPLLTGSHVSRGAPGPAFPAANWRVGGATAPGELGTRGTDSGAPVTLGHGRGCIACNGAASAMHVPVTRALRS